MADPNPYEAPQTEVSLRPGQVVKRGFGVALILALTPLAMAIAVFASCTASRWVDSLSPTLTVTLVPLACLTGLMVWAAFLDRRRKDDANQRLSRSIMLLLTPLAVGIAMAVGFGLAAAVVLYDGARSGGLTERGMWWGGIVFWSVPGAALLVMLALAWRSRRG